MHLADGTVANQICTVTTIASAAAIAFAVTRVRPYLNRPRLARAVLAAAVVFGAQMVDVPLFGAVGVHLIGATVLVALAGAPLALISMALILAVQALLLGDGGVAVLGANVFNMSVAAVGVSWLVMRAVRASIPGRAGIAAGVAVASAASVMAAVVAMSLELALSGAGNAFTATMPAHAPFAAWETLITASVGAVVLFAPRPVRIARRANHN